MLTPASDCDAPRCSHVRHPKARKEYVCAECGAVIRTGERYYQISGIDDEGVAYSHRTCLACEVASVAFFALGREAESGRDVTVWTYGSLCSDALELLDEYRGEAPEEWCSLAGHVFAMRERWGGR